MLFDDIDLLTPQIGVMIRLLGLVLALVITVRTMTRMIRVPSRDSFWDFTASVVIAASFGALALSSWSGAVAMEGNIDLHRALIAFNLILTSAAVGGAFALVLSWRPAKLD